MDKKNQPQLRLVVNNDDPRRCAQSTSGRSSSQVTFPADSRSMAIASASPQGRAPYATLRMCPALVPHFTAKDSRSANDIVLMNDLRSISNYHQTVIEKATLNVEFTKWCRSTDNGAMDVSDVRRENLAALIEREFSGNRSAFARCYDPPARPSYIIDLLNPQSGKAFGEKAARKAEKAAGLQEGQLDIPNSPLRLVARRPEQGVDDELRVGINTLDKEEKRELLDALRKIQANRGRRRKAG